MDLKPFIVMVVIALSAIGVSGDIFLKKASETDRLFLSWPFVIGFVIYSSTAFGWVIAMKYLKMATVGSVYSISTILLLAISGTLLFGESLSNTEWIGILLAIASLVILSRHA